MDPNAEKLFEYLRAVIYDPQRASLNLDELDGDFLMLGKGLVYFTQCVMEINAFAADLAKGDLSSPMPGRENEMAAPLKSLHASLRHLTWQSEQVAKGDYKQRVDFMGEFSESFNTMIRQLDTRQQALLLELDKNRQKTEALEQSNTFMKDIASNIPQGILVAEEETNRFLFCNNAIQAEVSADGYFMDKLFMVIAENRMELEAGDAVEFIHTTGGINRYLSLGSYPLHWGEALARAYILRDISSEKRQLQELQLRAYQDELTKLYNRYSGMQTLAEWLEARRQFVLIFIDLNSLKFVNDNYGHIQGDHYITTTARHLESFSLDAMVCRVGGDEFMILAPDLSEREAGRRMSEIARRLEGDCQKKDLPYKYSVSYGVVEINPDNALSASKVLQLADERMYRHKKSLKEAARQARLDG